MNTRALAFPATWKWRGYGKRRFKNLQNLRGKFFCNLHTEQIQKATPAVVAAELGMLTMRDRQYFPWPAHFMPVSAGCP